MVFGVIMVVVHFLPFAFLHDAYCCRVLKPRMVRPDRSCPISRFLYAVIVFVPIYTLALQPFTAPLLIPSLEGHSSGYPRDWHSSPSRLLVFQTGTSATTMQTTYLANLRNLSLETLALRQPQRWSQKTFFITCNSQNVARAKINLASENLICLHGPHGRRTRIVI